MDEEQMDEIISDLTDKLNEIFDGVADVKCVKGNKDELLGKMTETYMSYPIIKVSASRRGCDLSVDKCNVDEVINVLPNIIGSLLGLVPSDTRNEIIYQAINREMSDNGSLIDANNEEEDDE